MRTRAALPYAAVMATGLASELAPIAHASSLLLPLLWLGVTVAVIIGAGEVIRLRRLRKEPALTLPLRFGLFTVPIGLEVVADGLDRVGAPALRDAAATTTGIAWALTAVLMVGVARLLAQRCGRGRIDGVWFLAPAALLADAIGGAGAIGRLPESMHAMLGWLAVTSLGLGAIGYAGTLVLAAIGFIRSKWADYGRSSWWIAAGCGGLGAAAAGRVSTVALFSATGTSREVFEWTCFGFWAAGTAVLVPVVAVSLGYLVRTRRARGVPPWTPTFSTGVYALGTLALARLFDVPVLSTVASAAAVVTLAMWAITVVGRLAAARTHRQGSRLEVS